MTAPTEQSAPKSPRRRNATASTRKATPAVKVDATEAARAPLTPDDWTEAATAVLIDQGIDHVRVDTLAGRLGVTRGSFYWHFRDREDLLRRVLHAWAERTTAQLTRRLQTAHDNPQAQLRDVISLPFRGRAAGRAARIELAIRAWARRDEMARRAVDEADASRIGYHAQVFGALGFDEAEARMRAFLLYSYEVAESLLHGQGEKAEQLGRRAFVERLMQQPIDGPRGEPIQPISEPLHLLSSR